MIKVKPNARVSALMPGTDGVWTARLKAPPVDGRANKELIAVLAAYWGCPPSRIRIKSGAGARIKQVCIDTDDPPNLKRIDRG